MKRNDKVLIVIIALFAIAAGITTVLLQRQTGGTAFVSVRGQDVLEIDLSNGAYTILNETYLYYASGDEDNASIARCFIDDHIYCVNGELGVVVIAYEGGQVRVIEETSPQNICQIQGATNSPMKPLTCLPNRVSVSVRPDDDDDNDFFS